MKWQHDSLQNCYAGVRFPSTPPGGEASELLRSRGESKAGASREARARRGRESTLGGTCDRFPSTPPGGEASELLQMRGESKGAVMFFQQKKQMSWGCDRGERRRAKSCSRPLHASLILAGEVGRTVYQINCFSQVLSKFNLKSPGGGMVYTQDLKFCGRKAMWVRSPPRAPARKFHVRGNVDVLKFFI